MRVDRLYSSNGGVTQTITNKAAILGGRSLTAGGRDYFSPAILLRLLIQRRSNIRTGSAAYFLLIGFLVIFLCIVAPPVGTRCRRVRFVLFYRTSYAGSTSRQHLATVTRYADCVKQHFQTARRRLVANYTKFITRLL